MAEKLKESDWDNLLLRIDEKNCTPFIGAGACAGTLPLGSDIAREWADKYGYPLIDKGNLARVSQFLAVDQDPIFPKEQIRRRFTKIAPPDFDSRDEPHALLADLNLPIYITTNYDSFMYLALQERQRDPKRELCQWNPLVDLKTPSVFSMEEAKTEYEPTPANPLVYHLHGHYDTPQSMVLTEDDYLNFMVNFSSDQNFLPAPIRAAFAGTSLLFIGYSLSDWNFRVLFRGLIGSQAAGLGYTSVAVQLAPSAADNSEKGRLDAQKYLDTYFEKIQQVKVRVYWGDIKEFTTELRQRWEEFSNGSK
jgi:hypothetical protein